AVFPQHFVDENGDRQKSFDEILDQLLNRKKSLASNTLFPTEQAEVKPDEIFGTVFQSAGKSVEDKPLTLDQVDKLTPTLFEAFIAALYSKKGYQVYLTPNSNDRGVDVVALKDTGNLLLQVKQSQSALSNNAIQEVFTAKTYYCTHFSE